MKMTIIEESYRGYTITLKQYNDRPWHVMTNSPFYIFESCSLFQDENDALEYAKLLIDKWHAERKEILSSKYGIMNNKEDETDAE